MFNMMLHEFIAITLDSGAVDQTTPVSTLYPKDVTGDWVIEKRLVADGILTIGDLLRADLDAVGLGCGQRREHVEETVCALHRYGVYGPTLDRMKALLRLAESRGWWNQQEIKSRLPDRVLWLLSQANRELSVNSWIAVED